jgi:hypothetical protein
MRGASNRVNTVWGESVLSCNTFGSLKMEGFRQDFHRRKRNSGFGFKR